MFDNPQKHLGGLGWLSIPLFTAALTGCEGKQESAADTDLFAARYPELIELRHQVLTTDRDTFAMFMDRVHKSGSYPDSLAELASDLERYARNRADFTSSLKGRQEWGEAHAPLARACLELSVSQGLIDSGFAAEALAQFQNSNCLGFARSYCYGGPLKEIPIAQLMNQRQGSEPADFAKLVSRVFADSSRPPLILILGSTELHIGIQVGNSLKYDAQGQLTDGFIFSQQGESWPVFRLNRISNWIPSGSDIRAILLPGQKEPIRPDLTWTQLDSMVANWRPPQ